jgi:UDP-glucose 4-epimerase
MPAPSTQRVYVTGGRGRLASLIAGHFAAPAHEVTLFSRTAGDGFRPLAGLLQPGGLGSADLLLHLAWSTLPATSELRTGVERTEDLPFLEALLAAAAVTPVRERLHLVFFSSGGTVYGNAPGRPSLETDACRPIGNYGRAKLAAEEMILAHAARHGQACTILRISNPYGYPVPVERVQGIIPHAIRCATAGQPLALWGDGSAQKDFLHYRDFLAALAAVLERRLTGVYNLSAGESHRICEVIEKVEAQVGRKIPLAYAPAPAWDVQDSRLDNGRLVAATGWRPKVTLAEGIRREAAGSTPP